MIVLILFNKFEMSGRNEWIWIKKKY
jgi:hypothetical protein